MSAPLSFTVCARPLSADQAGGLTRSIYSEPKGGIALEHTPKEGQAKHLPFASLILEMYVGESHREAALEAKPGCRPTRRDKIRFLAKLVVIAAVNTPSTLAVKAATRTIPIIFGVGSSRSSLDLSLASIGPPATTDTTVAESRPRTAQCRSSRSPDR
jgi:hypothetical protein